MRTNENGGREAAVFVRDALVPLSRLASPTEPQPGHADAEQRQAFGFGNNPGRNRDGVEIGETSIIAEVEGQDLRRRRGGPDEAEQVVWSGGSIG